MKTILRRAISFLLAFAIVFAMMPAVGLITAYAVTLNGFVDTVTCPAPGKIQVSGWGMDMDDKAAAVEIHVYVGSPAVVGEGHNLGYTSVYRGDVNFVHSATGNHGYDTVFDTAMCGTQDVYVYVISGNINREFGPFRVFVRQPGAIYGDMSWTIAGHDGSASKPDGVYRIASAANPNYSLDILLGAGTDGANLQLYSNNESDCQLFHLRRIHRNNMVAVVTDKPVVSFMNINSQKYLDQDSDSFNVRQNESSPDDTNRQWVMKNNGDGTYSFESVEKPGNYMTIEGGIITNGANIGVAPWTNSIYQKFILNAEYVHADNRLNGLPGYLISGEHRLWNTTSDNANNTFVMDIDGASTAEGANVQIWTAVGSIAHQQIFDIQKDSEGWYTIRNISSGLYVVASDDPNSNNGYNVTQHYSAGDEAKWSFIPIIRSDNKISYWIANKATGLYLSHSFEVDGSNVALSALDLAQSLDASWAAWGVEHCHSTAPNGTITNDATGIAANQFDTSDIISLPIKIYDYRDDGLLFEYSLAGTRNNAGFSLTAPSTNDLYPCWTIGQTTAGPNDFREVDSNSTYFIGSNKFWTRSPDGLNPIYTVNHGALPNFLYGGSIDLEYLSDYLGYSVYGEMTSGLATLGLVKPTLKEVNGHKLLEYNDEVVAYIADLLDHSLGHRELYWSEWITSGSMSVAFPVGTKENLPEGHTDDMAGLLLEQLKRSNNNVLLHYSADAAARSNEIYTNLEETMSKQHLLIGTWNECKQYITTYTDAAYFILNNLFYPRSYNIPQDKFDYLVLSKAKLSNGKTAYVFDSDFSDTYDYNETTKSAVMYDFAAKTISNTSMMGKPGYRTYMELLNSPYYTFLPVWEREGVQLTTFSPYSNDPTAFANKNYNYVLQCNGVFTYTENDELFFDFAGDDDVYLFINGQLVLDIGGAHSVTTVDMNLNDYVYAAREAVAAGSTDPRDLALALVDGEDYAFDFYYMERHTSDANMRIATNIRVSDPNLDTEKKAYQKDQELINGGLVNPDDHVEYSFSITNPADSIANLYHLSFADAKLGVTIDAISGLTVSGSKTLNKGEKELTAGDLKIYFTNQQGMTHEVLLQGSTPAEVNEELKLYLKEVNGHGLLPGCSIEIRGIYYNVEDSDFVSGRFINTLHVTANQKADGSGSTYQDSVNMVVCIASGPQYYQWSGHSLDISADKFTTDVNNLLIKDSPLLEQIAPATSLNSIQNLQLCDMKGNVTYSNFITASADCISINYNKPGTYVFYVKVTQTDNSTLVIPVQVYVVDVVDSVFVLDYGLNVDLSKLLTANDTISVAGKSTLYSIEAITATAPDYIDNHIIFSDDGQSIKGAFGDYLIANNCLTYRPKKFIEGADSIYVAIRVFEGTPGTNVGSVNINKEVEMYKKITILPANVLYYEDDFSAIHYHKNDTPYGGSADLNQSADPSGQYGYDDVYGSGTTQSGSTSHEIMILDTDPVVEFTFKGTGFELISRCQYEDKSVLFVDIYNESGVLIKSIPVITEYNNKEITGNEAVYQVPIVKVDDLPHGKYTVKISGVPMYDKDSNGNYTINTTNPPILFIDGIRIYDPLSMSDPYREYYINGEDTADFVEIRDLILEGKGAVVTYNKDDYTITTGTSIFTENRNNELYPVNTFTITSLIKAGFFADVFTDAKAGENTLVLRTEDTRITDHQFKLTFAKTEGNYSYYYIHINIGTGEYYLTGTENGTVSLLRSDALDLTNNNCLWEINYLDSVGGIVTIRNKADGSYLSASAIDANAKSGQIVTITTDTITEAQKWELGSVPFTSAFNGNIVTSVNDYLVFGPNNELYLDGINTTQGFAFYFTPDDDPATTTMLQVGVHVLNDQRLFGKDGELKASGVLYQSANTGTPGYLILDEKILTSTERYYRIDLSRCKYDEQTNRYEVILFCKGGYLSFTNLKVSGGSVCSVNGDVADLRYNNGVLELLTSVGASGTQTWTAVSNPQDYVDFQSVYRHMRSTVFYEQDVDTGEFVPALPEYQGDIQLIGRSLLFKDIIKMRFYFDISSTGVTTTTPENSGLLVWSEEEYAAASRYTVETAGVKLRGLTASVNGHYADTRGIPAKNMGDLLYVRAYVILPDGTYSYSEVSQFSPVMYAQLVLEKQNTSATMKELVIALMNYGAAAQINFNYKTEALMNSWLTEEQRNAEWSEDLINALPADTSKYTFTADERIVLRGSSVTFVGAVNQNFYFHIPQELLEGAQNVELLYWTETDYQNLTHLTVENAKKASFSVANGRAVIDGTAAKSLGNAFYFAIHIVYENIEIFSTLHVDSAHDYARRVLSSNATTDAMKNLAKALVIYSCKAKSQLGG